ncbi:hypothetical protein PAHAL_1G096200 [Panicum hallii]|uniref:Uncharacterized protein n=1 Tax=Panicum hallii TaxID=206008 RepID=A0A2S3GNB9_9POAL|nr:hypothetical protein PAHAL_1G096200 [Panicum hallii]
MEKPVPAGRFLVQCFPTMEQAGEDVRTAAGRDLVVVPMHAKQTEQKAGHDSVAMMTGSPLKCLCILIDAAMIQRPTREGRREPPPTNLSVACHA